MRFVLAAVAAFAALTAAFALPAGAHVATPGPQCGGTLWKLMTLSDTAKTAVHWTPAATSIADIAKLTAPAKITTRAATHSHRRSSHRVIQNEHRCKVSIQAAHRTALRCQASVSRAPCLFPRLPPRIQADARDAQRVPQAVPGPDEQLAAARCDRHAVGRRLLESRQDDSGCPEERRRVAPAPQLEHHAGLREVLSAAGRASSTSCSALSYS